MVAIKRYITDTSQYNLSTQTALATLTDIGNNISNVKQRFNRDVPDVVT